MDNKKVDGSYITYNANRVKYEEKYFLNGEKHREDGAAYIQYYENGNICREKYYINGLLHRLDGPAVVVYHKYGNIFYQKFHINGEFIEVASLEEFKKIVKLMVFK